MTVASLALPKLQLFDADGNPLAGGFLDTYQAGTSTPLATYTDSTGGTPNANPVILNSAGEADVWLTVGTAYKLRARDANSVALWTVDNIAIGSPSLDLAGYSATVTQMRLKTDPGEVGSESLATTMAGELERLRFALYDTKHALDPSIVQWYETPYAGLLIDVRSYGAVGDGVVDDTVAIQAALTAAAAAGSGIWVPGTHKVSNLLVANGVKMIAGPGTLVGTGVVGNGVVELSGTVVGLNYSVNISMAGGAKTAIYGVAQTCTFHDCALTNFTDVNGHCGIHLRPDSSNTRIHGVVIALVQPPLAANHTAQGIYLESNVTNNFGTYFSSGTGASEDPSLPVHHCTITGNSIFGGSHGIFAQGIRQCSLTGNTIQRSWHRAIGLEPSCKYNTIAGNTLYDFYSSAVLLAYGAQYNVVSGNVCSSTLTNGQAAIALYLGPVGNTITGNSIRVSGTSPLYGIYCAIGATNNVITGNNIIGHRYAAIALESDWQNSGGLPGAALVSLPPPGAPSAVTGGTETDWAYATSQYNVVQDNAIGAPNIAGGHAAVGIYVAAMGATFGIDNTVVKGNYVASTDHDYQWYVFEDSAAHPVANTWLLDNSWNTGFFHLGERGQGHCKAIKGNYALDYGIVYGLSDGDTTPDVTVGNDFVTQNSAGTQLTFFDGTVLANREITLRMDVNTGITHDNAKIRLAGAASIAQGSVDANFFIHFRNIGGGAAGIWFEMWRRG